MAKDEIDAVSRLETADSTPLKKQTKGLDDALVFVSGREPIEWTEQEERKVVRKIDFVLVTMVSLD
jgi:hypothetical protein